MSPIYLVYLAANLDEKNLIRLDKTRLWQRISTKQMKVFVSKKIVICYAVTFLWYSQVCFAWKNAIKGYILLIDLYCKCIFSKSYFEIHKLFSLLSAIPNLKSYHINKGSLLACSLVLLKEIHSPIFSHLHRSITYLGARM